MNKYVIGIDVGGTNIKLGLVNFSGQVISRNSFETRHFMRAPKKLMDAIIVQIQDITRQNKLLNKNIAGIGLGLPGLVDTGQGIVRFLPNIPGWKNVPLKKKLEDKLRLPVFLENDVNLIALGEWKYGAGRGSNNLICMTLGTGVGGGLILDGRLYRGPGFAAGELGHIPINEQGPSCNCGGYGCLESYVGNKHLLKRAVEMMKDKTVTLEVMNQLAGKGNKQALRFWHEAATHLGNGLVGIVNLLNPQRIVIGGGVSNNHRFLFKTMAAVIRKRAMPVQAAMMRIVRAQLGNDAGILGALVLIHERRNS